MCYLRIRKRESGWHVCRTRSQLRVDSYSGTTAPCHGLHLHEAAVSTSLTQLLHAEPGLLTDTTCHNQQDTDLWVLPNTPAPLLSPTTHPLPIPQASGMTGRTGAAAVGATAASCATRGPAAAGATTSHALCLMATRGALTGVTRAGLASPWSRGLTGGVTRAPGAARVLEGTRGLVGCTRVGVTQVV
jgi:hypothetical protein